MKAKIETHPAGLLWLVTWLAAGLDRVWPHARRAKGATNKCSAAKLMLLVAVTRIATPSDASALAANIAEGFDGYRAWAPSDWTPPVPGSTEVERLAGALARADVWCLLALDGSEVVGHVALALVTREDPGPPPSGTVFLWQLFVRSAWHGHGVAKQLMEAAAVEAATRGFSRIRLWTPQGAGRARRFYEREGWTPTGRVDRRSLFGLPTVEYGRSAGSSNQAP
jgi:GNAT superfamily N-acetyltransferase